MAVRVITTTHPYLTDQSRPDNVFWCSAEKLANLLKSEKIDRIIHGEDLGSLALARVVGKHHECLRVMGEVTPDLIKHYNDKTILIIADPKNIKEQFNQSRGGGIPLESIRVAPYTISIFTYTASGVEVECFNKIDYS